MVDSTQGGNNRSIVNDAQGRVLYVNQAGNVRRQLVVNGEVLGLYGVAIDPVNPVVNTNQPFLGNVSNPNFANLADSDFGYAKISASYPTPAPGPTRCSEATACKASPRPAA